ncbi:serine carboxypeptidase [Mycena amicta]|nr:serine carboxypeptidase [Mycena amicta]
MKSFLPLLTALVLLLSACGVQSQDQAFIHTPAVGNFHPLGSLSAVSSSGFSTLEHPAFPHHGVRIKKSDFCDGSVNAYTGYIDVEARHLFFYFFESRSNPDEDDVVLWTNGGPGCSSGLGLFMELGPCRIVNGSEGPVYHEESWNSRANVFFIDQPIGVGFSYADYGEFVSTTEEAAKDIAAFVAIFFAHFQQFQGHGFHLSGESYAGRYLPLFAAAIYDQNAALVQQGLAPINLTSVIIGNGMTDLLTMFPAWYDLQCTHASIPPVQHIQTCVEMQKKLPRCTKWWKKSCHDIFDPIGCAAANSFCAESLLLPFFELGLNMYDMTKSCADASGDVICYPVVTEIENYLNREDVRVLLGVDARVPVYSQCNDDVNRDFSLKLDIVHGGLEYVEALLERGVRVLIYAGTYDWAANWKGNEQWTRELEWSGRGEFAGQELREWFVGIGESESERRRAGITRAAKGLTFATIDAAGHMAPYDKPKESLVMLNRWLAGIPL